MLCLKCQISSIAFCTFYNRIKMSNSWSTPTPLGIKKDTHVMRYNYYSSHKKHALKCLARFFVLLNRVGYQIRKSDLNLIPNHSDIYFFQLLNIFGLICVWVVLKIKQKIDFRKASKNLTVLFIIFQERYIVSQLCLNALKKVYFIFSKI